MDPVERFAGEAEAFRAWATLGMDTGEDAARNALLHVVRLYLAALELPPAWSEQLAHEPDAERVGENEWRTAFAAAGRLPLDIYAACDPHFDPVVGLPTESAGIGSLSDDLGDIYRDVVTGLRAFESGRRAVAVWEWGFGFRHHWGEHATGAIRALHAWLAADAFDRLSANATPPV